MRFDIHCFRLSCGLGKQVGNVNCGSIKQVVVTVLKAFQYQLNSQLFPKSKDKALWDFGDAIL